MLPSKFHFIWQSGFRGKAFLEIDKSETRIDCGGHVCKQIGTKSALFIEDPTQMLLNKFRFIWQSGFRGEDFLNSANQNQVSVYLAKRFERRRFLEIDQSEKRIDQQPCLLTNRNETSNLYRGPPINASYQVSIHLAKWFQRRFFKIGQSETRIA